MNGQTTNLTPLGRNRSMSVHTSKSGRPNGVLESVNMKKSERKSMGKSGQNDKIAPLTKGNFDSAIKFLEKINESQPDKATARPLTERMKSLVKLYADSSAKPAAISFEYDELVQAVNEHAALEAVADAARFYRECLKKSKLDYAVVAKNDLDLDLANLVEIRSQKAGAK